jgi:hypothetical protein
LAAMVLAAIEAGSQDTQEYKSTDAVVSERPCLTRVRCQMLLAKSSSQHHKTLVPTSKEIENTDKSNKR